jgi:tetratricopeptide (TPR) repeat protein
LATIDNGLPPEDAMKRATELVLLLREGKLSAADTHLDDDAVDVLYAACRLLPKLEPANSKDPVKDANNLFDFIENATWPEPDFGEKAELLADCSFSAWRISRTKATAAETDKWLKKFTSAAESAPQLRLAVDAMLRAPDKALDPVRGVALEELAVLLHASQTLFRLNEASPEAARGVTEQLYQSLKEAKFHAGSSEERNYFLGLLALIAGAASRFVFRREEARRWFALAESWLLLTRNPTAPMLRLAYARLCLRMEERHFEEVRMQVPELSAAFKQLGLLEDVLKCRFLEGGSLRELRRTGEAVEIFSAACREAEELGSWHILPQAMNCLAQVYRILGNLPEALKLAQKALPLLKAQHSRVSLSKLKWAVGDILREQGNLKDAVDAYREALTETEEIGTRNDSAEIHLVLAEVLLDLGQYDEAEQEIRAALPVIEEEKMVPEGYAALALLQESLRRRKIDRQALRNLHGYFQDEKP